MEFGSLGLAWKGRFGHLQLGVQIVPSEKLELES